MVVENKKMGIWEFFTSFFPFQLLKAHLKYNLLALLYWTFLFLTITDNFGSKFGVPILFFSPEYLGTVSFWSFLLLGFSFGGFTMGFNTYSYIRLGAHFSFLATLNQPFYKFCINNALLPITFNIVFMVMFSRFQIREEFASTFQVITYNLAYLGGFVFFHLLSVLYFFPMNRRVSKSLLGSFQLPSLETLTKTLHTTNENSPSNSLVRKEKKFIYLGTKLKFHSSRSGQHYSLALLSEIYRKNRINATLFETLAIVSFLLLGLFRDFKFFELPASASIVLLFTIFLMLFSALLSWLNRWAYPILIVVFLAMNYLSLQTALFTFKNYAYGISYATKSNYTIEDISRVTKNAERNEQSFANIIQILENWKAKTKEEKPKLILVDVSGGGSRSALWSLSCMQNLDKAMQHNFTKHVQMITGASGGMIGSAYYRELYYRYKKGKLKDPLEEKYKRNIAADLLNKLSFAATTNDIFFRYQSFMENGYRYPKDRGTSFENELNENTGGALDVDLKHYTQIEKAAEIPLMVFTPTIVNDGRRLLISSQSLAFLTENTVRNSTVGKSYENIDYLSFFEAHDPCSIRFSSILRASATFPFVMPMVTMPTNPEIQLMDAGIRDNYGGKITIDYLSALSEWIRKNTSGVIIVQIRDTKKVLDNESYQEVSLFDKFTLPFGNMYANFTRTQDFDQEQLMLHALRQYTFPVDLISFNLRENKSDKISLSWHLTSQEKKKINEAFNSPRNQKSLIELKKLLN